MFLDVVTVYLKKAISSELKEKDACVIHSFTSGLGLR